MEQNFIKIIMDIYEIKRRTLKTAPYFFSRDTLKFFGQRMRDFKVAKLNEYEYFISAPSYSYDYKTGQKIKMSNTEKIFDTRTNKLETPKSN